MGRPTVEQVKALAPDAASLHAGQRLATAAPWSGTGCDDRAVWGTCRGSAKLPYQVACDTEGPAYKCSCPSRKFPCKHALALLLLWAHGAPIVTDGSPPPDVAAWLAARSAQQLRGTIADAVVGKEVPVDGAPAGSEAPVDGAAPSGTGGEQAAGAPSGTSSPGTAGAPLGTSSRGAADAPSGPGRDPAESARLRAEQRTKRIVAGMEELDRWLGDLLRHGLGYAQTQPYRYWDEMAARLVDAQAPAAASRVRGLPGVVRSGDQWPERLLSQVCRLHLLAAGWARHASLPESVRADLRTAAGWPWPTEQVLAGPKEEDHWYVLARRVTENDQVRAQRTWLWGLESQRPAVIVDFARPGMAFTWDLWPGNVLPATVARYPGTAPLRVVVAERSGEPEPGGPPPAWEDLEALADARSTAFTANPWLESWPVSVTGVVPDHRKDRWFLVDRRGRTSDVRVADEAGWRLLAVSAGRPMQVLGEWEDDALIPLGAWVEDRMVVL
ncbi:MAG TPA: SWIM zinc finger family protein [Acidimicrobiales bacterium]|nr:SWIM zinc finger family protein [Acidimicrobiales bacterium]